MNGSATGYFCWGATALGWWVAGLFFLRFWRLSGDRLFLLFFLAFWAFALERLAGLTEWLESESRPLLYLLRLLGFLLIIIAVIDKNRRADRPDHHRSG